MSSLTEHAERILALAKRLDQHAAENGLQPTSFDTNTLAGLPADLEKVRRELVDSNQILKRLALGPVDMYMEILFTVCYWINHRFIILYLQFRNQPADKCPKFTDLLSIRFIYNYNIAKHVPIDGDISFADLAAAIGQDEILVRRFVQHAMANHIFSERRAGYVSHTAASKLLKEDPEAMDTVGFLIDDIAPASVKVIKALQKWPGSGEPTETGFNIEENTSDPFYIHIGRDQERARRFGAGMRFMSRGALYDIRHLLKNYDWARIDHPGGLVVDLGGGHGAVSRALAAGTQHLHCIVQDLPGTAEEGAKLLDPKLKDRVEFMAHDFLQPQPIQSADVYFFRFILHNWSDKYCTIILRSLIPAMKAGSRVVIYEFLIPDVASTSWSQKHGR